MTGRILVRLLFAAVLIGSLLLLWSGNVDFVYTGF